MDEILFFDLSIQKRYFSQVRRERYKEIEARRKTQEDKKIKFKTKVLNFFIVNYFYYFNHHNQKQEKVYRRRY